MSQLTIPNNTSAQSLALLRFLEPSGTAIEILPKTGWGEHIPFMFCLMNYLRPRTYVELGTHHGASFFAVCQAIREFEIDCKPTAVDLWLGDEHAGKYDESVYRSFKQIYEDKYTDIGRILRQDFNDAVADFEDHSLDLIHIDGLHTYDAVKNDYDKWLGKATENGVILFHDTMMREKGFGVWKLWDEIKDSYTSFNFTHSYGLGVIALGSAASNPLIPLLQAINYSQLTKSSFDNFFRLVGERSVGEVVLKRKLQAARNKIPRLIGKYFSPLSLFAK